MNRAVISLGSNIEPQHYLREALKRLGRLFRIRKISNVFRTRPAGGRRQPWFLNCSILIETAMGLDEIRARLRKMEREMGRERTGDRFASRIIDLDLVLFGDEFIGKQGIPDPDIYERNYLAESIRELLPGYRLPGTGRSIDDIAAESGGSGMVPLPDFTELLRKDIHGHHHGN